MSSVKSRTIIEITPSEAQYGQLVKDLETLRTRGAPSNTAAIIEAVRLAAGYDGPSTEMAGQRANAPGPAPGGKS